MADLDDLQGWEDTLETELTKLDEYQDVDATYVKQWVRMIDGDVEPSTLSNYLQQLRMTSRRLDNPVVELTERRLDDHVYDLRHDAAYGQGSGGMSNSTVRMVQFVVRKFLSDHPEIDAEWTADYELVSQETETVHPEDMLDTSDIQQLRDGCLNQRDIAMIEFLADTGARLTMMGSLRVKDVDLEGETATYTPNRHALGLKGAEIMEYPIIDSRADLRAFLNQTHPRPDTPEAAFFHKLPASGRWDFSEGDDGAIHPNAVRKQLKSIADRAGVEKPVNPHNFRHSAVTRMRREGYSRSQIEHRVHWEIDSDMWQVYEHIAGEEHNQDIFQAAGVTSNNDEGPNRERHPCGNCRETLAPQHEFCPSCGAPASMDAREALETERDAQFETAVESDDPGDREVARDLASVLDIDEELAARVVDARTD